MDNQDIIKHFLEVLNLNSERGNEIYADTKSDIIILVAYLAHKNIIDIDDYQKHHKENKKSAMQLMRAQIKNETGENDKEWYLQLI